MNPESDDRHWRYLVLLFIAFLPGAYSLPAIPDVDYWWHLRVGEWVREHRDVPTTDPFSRPGIDGKIPWMAYSWLFEVAADGFRRACDGDGPSVARGMMVFKTLLNSATFLVLALSILGRQGVTWFALAVLALVTIPTTNLMSERPWHFTIWGTAATLTAVDSLLRGGRSRCHWLQPILYAVWANTHIQFVLGFAIFGAAFLECVRRSIFNRAVDPNLARLCALGAACTLATLMNPYHLRLWLVIRDYATQTAALDNVSELRPPAFDEWRQWVLLGLFALTAVSLITRRLPAWECLLFATGLFFALRMRRDIWFGALACGTILVTYRRPEGRTVPLRPIWLAAAALVGVLLPRLLLSAAATFGTPAFEKTEEDAFPVESVRWLKQNPQPGPIFNSFDWGGYLIWSLREYPVGIDGRTNLYGQLRLQRSFATWAGAEDWEADPQLRAAGFVLAPVPTAEKPCGLTDRLLAAPERWRVLHRDGNAIIFSRPGP